MKNFDLQILLKDFFYAEQDYYSTYDQDELKKIGFDFEAQNLNESKDEKEMSEDFDMSLEESFSDILYSGSEDSFAQKYQK